MRDTHLITSFFVGPTLDLSLSVHFKFMCVPRIHVSLCLGLVFLVTSGYTAFMFLSGVIFLMELQHGWWVVEGIVYKCSS